MGLVMCPSCNGAISSEAKFCPLCGASMQGQAPEPGTTETNATQTLASKEANARLAAGKRLRAEDKAQLMMEAAARGEKVGLADKLEVGGALITKIVFGIFALLILCLILYGCAASII